MNKKLEKLLTKEEYKRLLTVDLKSLYKKQSKDFFNDKRYNRDSKYE